MGPDPVTHHVEDPREEHNGRYFTMDDPNTLRVGTDPRAQNPTEHHDRSFPLDSIQIAPGDGYRFPEGFSGP